jgi:NAD(P)-dependent dehydrogenase (short-subunit alcohol dehydrogenase family)
LEGKSVLITSAGAGIGRASAMLFAAEGARVGVVDIEATMGQRVVDAIEEAGGRAVFVQTDVSDAGAVEAAVNAVAEAFGGLDVLYNNAGGATPHDGSLVDMPLDEFQHAIGLNLFGPFAAIRFAIPWMIERGGGSIINTASIRAMIGTVGADGYTAAKGGIVSMTRALALQLGRHRIRVNAIAPGAVLTERVRGFMANGNDSGPDEALIKRHILGLGEPEDVAKAALFFASDDSRWVTGQILPVDGGASAN